MSCEKTLKKAIDTVRLLAADGVQKAKSGHPGMPMGCADYAYTLWHDFLRHDPQDPTWIGRDRFILSAGHGSMLLYSLLHLFEYPVSLEDLKQFRQWDSITPGHPEVGLTPGVEVTTGPLGSGFATGVGMAMAAKQLAARMGSEELFNQRIFVLSSDGCMMEGITHEAASLAGHQKLGNMIVFYDDNEITIEGCTSLAFSEDVGKRFEAYGWQVCRVNGHDPAALRQALDAATAETERPSMIIGRTQIGHGAPNKAGKPSAHGEPLGDDEIAGAKAALGFDPEQKFIVTDDVREFCHQRVLELGKQADAWRRRFTDFLTANPEKAALLKTLQERRPPADSRAQLLAAVPEKEMATRVSGGLIMQKIAEILPAFTGGAADLNPSTKTHLDAEADFSPACRAGRNIHFGVREFCMGLCANGMALYGTAVPFTATFAVFSDFMKPAIRLAAIQKLHVIFVFTHDSVFVGEDGPTHQPIDQLAMLRAIPGLTVLRPGDSREVAEAWNTAINADGPVTIFLTRQNVENVPAALTANMDVSKGAYILSNDSDFEVILLASGSEIMLTENAAALLRAKGRKVRVVSMPSWELFEAQPATYRESVLPPACRQRVSVEMGTTMGWDKYVGLDGLKIGIDHFGHSAPYQKIAEEYGFTPEKIAGMVEKHLGL